MVEIIIGFDLVCIKEECNNVTFKIDDFSYNFKRKMKYKKRWILLGILCTDVCLARALHQENPGKNAFFCLTKSFVAAIYLLFYKSVLLNVHMDVFLTSNAFIRSSFSPFNSMVFFSFLCVNISNNKINCPDG